MCMYTYTYSLSDPCPSLQAVGVVTAVYDYVYIHTYTYLYTYIFICIYSCVYIHACTRFLS